MDAAAFKVIVDTTIKETADLLVKKNAEYAGSTDVLANFKRNAEKNGQTVLETWQTYYGKHVDGINTYMARVKERAVHYALMDVVQLNIQALKGDNGILRHQATDAKWFQERVACHLPMAVRTVNAELSEPIEGRFNDLINYSILCKAILSEIAEGNEKR